MNGNKQCHFSVGFSLLYFLSLFEIDNSLRNPNQLQSEFRIIIYHPWPLISKGDWPNQSPYILSRLGSDRLDDSRCKKTAAATDRLTEPKRIVIKISLSGWQHAIELLSVRTVRSDHGIVVGMTVRAKNLTLIMPKKPSKPPPHHATSVAHPSIMNKWVE